MKSSIRELARALYANEGPVDVYELHERFLLSSAELLSSIQFLQGIGVISEERDGFVRLSPQGRERIWDKRHELLMSRDRPWTAIALDRLDPAAPYLPDLSKVELSFFYSKVAESKK